MLYVLFWPTSISFPSLICIWWALQADSSYVCISCVLLLNFEYIAVKYPYKPVNLFWSIQQVLREPLVPEDVKIIIMKSSLKQSCHLLLVYILLASDYMPVELMP